MYILYIYLPHFSFFQRTIPSQYAIIYTGNFIRSNGLVRVLIKLMLTLGINKLANAFVRLVSNLTTKDYCMFENRLFPVSKAFETMFRFSFTNGSDFWSFTLCSSKPLWPYWTTLFKTWQLLKICNTLYLINNTITNLLFSTVWGLNRKKILQTINGNKKNFIIKTKFMSS